MLFTNEHEKISINNIYSSSLDRERIIEFLIQKGADVEIANNDNYTPIFMAAMSGKPFLVQNMRSWQ